MLQSRIPSTSATLTSLATALNNLGLCSKHALKPQRFTCVQTRNASHATQGRANGPKDSAGRRLGAKKSASEWVIPGNIIFKQRGKTPSPFSFLKYPAGAAAFYLHNYPPLLLCASVNIQLTGTKWFPGENVGIGKDHTIYAMVPGYVRYYRNPSLHPKRRYIGVALSEKGPGSQLPTPPNAPTRRRLGMHAVPMKEPVLSSEAQASKDSAYLQAHISASSVGSTTPKTVPAPPQGGRVRILPRRPTVSPFSTEFASRAGGYGLANYEIGRAAEKAGIVVKEFDRKDRWSAWRVRQKKVKEKMIARAARATRKTKGRKSSKGQKLKA